MSASLRAASEDIPMPTFTIVVDAEAFRGEGSTRLEAFTNALEQAARLLRQPPRAERAPGAGQATRLARLPAGPSEASGRDA